MWTNVSPWAWVQLPRPPKQHNSPVHTKKTRMAPPIFVAAPAKHACPLLSPTDVAAALLAYGCLACGGGLHSSTSHLNLSCA